MKLHNTILTAAMCAVLSVIGAPASAALVSLSGINAETGDTVSGSVDWSTSGSTLTITLTNTTGYGLTSNGDVLTGILFSPNIAPLSLTHVDVPAGSVLWSGKSTNTTGPLNEDGGWTDVFGASPYAGAVGASASGFHGMFAAGTLTKGTGGADYGIVSAGTYPQGGNGPGNPNQYPFADNALVLTFSGGGNLDNLKLDNIRLLFGTNGTGVICPAGVSDCAVVPPSQVPVPAAAWLLGSGLLGLFGVARRRVG